MKPLFNKMLYITIFLSSLAGCGQSPVEKHNMDTLAKDWNNTIPGNFSDQSQAKFDSLHIVMFFKTYPDLGSFEFQLRKFYKLRDYSYAWFEKGQIIEQAANLSNRIKNIGNDGIYQPMPYMTILDSLLSGGDHTLKDTVAAISIELMLTAQYFAFSENVWSGFDKDVSKDLRWYLPRKKVAYGQYLDSLLKEPAKMFVVNEPVYRQYDLLKKHLSKYKNLADTDRWPPLDFSGKSPQPGDSIPLLASIKSRLFKLQDFNGDTLNTKYDIEFVNAIKQFQGRHGLTIDGLLGKETNGALNVSLTNRIKQILVNMERCRWLPVKLNGDYLAVNIPEFQLHVYHADSLLWSCNVVVGKTVHPTVVFYGEIKYVVFSPYWNVPMSIVKNEILPGIKRNSSYLANHRMEITGHRQGLPVIRKRPGPQNSLGQVKFLFPNSYNIYLHDTPSKSLFGESSRDFSHGCIRVAEPAKLAAFLLKDWGYDKILKRMQAGKERYITLPNKTPVYIAYFTAFIDRKSLLNFRKDIYNRDITLAKMIINDV